MEYFLTGFDQNGKTVLNESFTSENDQQAIETGKKRLEEENQLHLTHRLTRSGKLLLFHR